MSDFDNPQKHGILKRVMEPEKVVCPKCNELVKNYTVIGRGICWKCKKVIPGSGMRKW